VTRIVVSVPGVTFDNMLFGDGWQLAELEGWWDTTKPRIVSDARPEWHGDFGQDTAYLEPRFITVSGVFQSRENPDLVTSARDTLAALHDAGEFEFTVSDGAVGRVTARMASELAWDVDYAPGCAAFEFTVKAEDPRRYGLGQSFSAGVPTQGVGVADPVLDPVQEGVAVDVATNHAQSLYGPTVPVEVRRNIATNPRMLSAVSLPSNNFPAANTLTKSAPLPVPHPQGIVTGAKSVSDGSSAELLSVYGVDNLTAAGSPERILGVWVLVTEPGYRIDSFGGWDAQELTANTWTYVTQATHLSADSWAGFQVSRITGMASTTAACYITGCVAAPGTVPPAQFFDDQYSPDPDMTPELIPGGNGASRLTGLHPTALTDSNCVSIIHEVGDGTRELRQIANAPSLTAETYFSVPVGVRASGTLMSVGRIETPSPNAGSSSFARQLIVSNPSHYSAEMANVAGSTQLRRTYASLADTYRARLRGQFGSGDVYWSKIGLFEGDYTGDWFDGSTQPHDTYIYKWAGVPYESAAIKQQIVHTPGNPGRIELTNTGTAPAEPMVRVTGGLSEGFELLCIETGDVVRVTRPIPDGSVIDVDMGAGQVWIDQQSPLSAMYVPVAEWFSVKPGHTCTIQFTPLGVQSGTPTMSVEFAEASW